MGPTSTVVERETCTLPQIGASEHSLGSLHLRAVSFRGPLHALLDEPRQDAVGMTIGARWAVGGVADGLGSCDLSHHGADAALNGGLPALAALLDEDPLANPMPAVDAAESACRYKAAALEVDERLLLTTFVAVAVSLEPVQDGSRRCVAVFAGDSPVLLLRPPGMWTVLSPETDGPANVVKSYLPGAGSGAVSFCFTVHPGEVLVLASDGFSTPLAYEENGLARGLATRWLPGPRALLPFVVDLAFDGHHDDRSVLAMWLAAPQEAA